jgi:hypothetical protein
MTVHMEQVRTPSGESTAVPLVLIASDSGYRIRCDRLPKATYIEIVMAIANPYWNDGKLIKGMTVWDSAYVLKTAMTNGTSHWFGHQIGDELYDLPRPVLRTVVVDGEYTAAQRIRKLSRSIVAHDMVGDFLGH